MRLFLCAMLVAGSVWADDELFPKPAWQEEPSPLASPEAVPGGEMRVFAGLTFVEIGALLNMPTKTAERRWRYATALLRERLGETPEYPVYEFRS